MDPKEKHEQELLRFVNTQPLLISLLYDLDLLPEQLSDHSSKAWRQMLAIALHWKLEFDSAATATESKDNQPPSELR